MVGEIGDALCTPPKIGVLALQGAFAKHVDLLERIGVQTLEIRYPPQLFYCDGLILPGGESTTMIRHILEMGFAEPLKKFAQHTPLFGTCAGMILMANPKILGLLDIAVERNAYGRQSDSFSCNLDLPFSSSPLQAIFIRAPRISSIHSSNVQILASHAGVPVCVRQGFHLATSFHPELTNDPVIHQYFIQLCIQEKQSAQQPSLTIPTKSFQTI